MKWLLSILVVVLGFVWWKRKRRAGEVAERKRSKSAEDSVASRQGTRRAVPMVACAYCGTHVPDVDAVSRAGKRFCTDAHAQLDSQ